MKTVLIEMDGRLGNQMFIYAFYKKMCSLYKDICFKVDISTVYQKKYECGLELGQVFPNSVGNNMIQASSSEIRNIEKKLTFKYRGSGSRILRDITDSINEKNRKKIVDSIITDQNIDDISNIKNWDNIRFFSGFWQKIAYYTDILPELQKDFTFKDFEDPKDIELAKKIAEAPSVSVHIRRGDYVGEILDILGVDYYKKLIDQILAEKPDAVLYFFSDDTDYIMENFKDVKKVVVNNNRDDFSNYRDMQLMSLCEYNIIANSTFSMWAALLNTHKDKKVYYPSKFTRDEETQYIDVPGFIRVEV